MDETLANATWHIKYRLLNGVLLSKGSDSKPFEVYKNKYLNRRLEYANKMARNFKLPYDICHLFAKDKQGNDLGEIARYDKVLKRFVFTC